MKCPVCGAAELIYDTRDILYTYKGKSTSIPLVTGDFCPACAESLLDVVESDRVMREMRAFSKQVNAAIVDPRFIAIRTLTERFVHKTTMQMVQQHTHRGDGGAYDFGPLALCLTIPV